jgi:hypothetical protein
MATTTASVIKTEKTPVTAWMSTTEERPVTGGTPTTEHQEQKGCQQQQDPSNNRNANSGGNTPGTEGMSTAAAGSPQQEEC